MRVDFNQMQEMTLPCPHQGTGQMSLRAYVGQGEKLVSCTIHPGGSIGLHSHPSSDDLHFVLMGTGVAICDGGGPFSGSVHVPNVPAGCCHFLLPDLKVLSLLIFPYHR